MFLIPEIVTNKNLVLLLVTCLTSFRMKKVFCRFDLNMTNIFIMTDFLEMLLLNSPQIEQHSNEKTAEIAALREELDACKDQLNDSEVQLGDLTTAWRPYYYYLAEEYDHKVWDLRNVMADLSVCSECFGSFVLAFVPLCPLCPLP